MDDREPNLISVFLPAQRRLDDLLAKQREVYDQLDMAEDDVAQVNDLLSMLQDAKEVRTTRPFRL